MKRYCEIEFDNFTRNRDTDGDIVGDYSICIIGVRKPTIQEVEQFCKHDMEITGYKYVVNVLEIDREEAHKFFDMENEDKLPIFSI